MVPKTDSLNQFMSNQAIDAAQNSGSKSAVIEWAKQFNTLPEFDDMPLEQLDQEYSPIPSGSLGINWSDNGDISVGNIRAKPQPFTTNSYGFYIKQKWGEVKNTVVNRGALGFDAILGRIDNEKAKAYGDIDYLRAVNNLIPDVETNNALVRVAGESAGLSKVMLETTKEGLKVGAAAAIVAGVAGQTPILNILPEEAVTIPKAFKYGLITGRMFSTMSIESGNMYLDLLEKDVDPEISKPISLTAGFMIAGLEEIGFWALAKPFRKKAVSTLVRSASFKQLARQGIAAYLKSTGAEVTTEMGQEVVSIVAEAIAESVNENPNKVPDIADIWSRVRVPESGKRILEVGEATLYGVQPFSLLGGGATSVRSSIGKNSFRVSENVNKLKDTVLTEGVYEETFETEAEANKAYSKTIEALKFDKTDATVTLEGTKVIVSNLSADAKDLFAVASRKKDGTYVIPSPVETVEKNVDNIHKALIQAGVNHSITFDPKSGKITLEGVDTAVIEEIARPRPIDSILKKDAFTIEDGKIRHQTVGTKDRDKVVKAVKRLNRNPLVNVNYSEELIDPENPETSGYDITIDVKLRTDEIIKRRDTSKITLAADNVSDFIGNKLFADMVADETVRGLGESLGYLLNAEKLPTELKDMFPLLADFEQEIINNIKDLRAGYDLFLAGTEEADILNLIMEAVKETDNLSENQLTRLEDFFKETVLTHVSGVFDVEMLGQRISSLQKSVTKGRQLTLREVNNIKKAIIANIKRALPRNMKLQGKLIADIESITTVGDFINSFPKLREKIETLQRHYYKNKINKLSTKTLPSEYKGPIELIQKALEVDDNKELIKLAKNMKQFKKAFTAKEMKAIFGDFFNVKQTKAEDMKKVYLALDYLQRLGALENRMISNVKANTFEEAVDKFTNAIYSNSTGNRRDALISHLRDKNPDVAASDDKAFLQKVLLTQLRPHNIYSLMGWDELFYNLSRASVSARENSTRSFTVFEKSVLGEDISQYGLLNDSVAYIKEKEVTKEKVLKFIPDNILEEMGEAEIAGQLKLSKLKGEESINISKAMTVLMLMKRQDGINKLVQDGFTYADLYLIQASINKNKKELNDVANRTIAFLTKLGQRVIEVQNKLGLHPDRQLKLIDNYFPLSDVLDTTVVENSFLMDMLAETIDNSKVQLEPGFLKKRTKSKIPISSLDYFSIMTNYVYAAEGYIAQAPILNDISKLLADERVYTAIQKRIGRPWYNEMWNHLRDTIRGTTRSDNAIGRIAQGIRENAYPIYLGFQVFSATKAAVSLLTGSYYMGLQYAFPGLVDFLQNPMQNFITARRKSTFLRNRAWSQERELVNLNKKMRKIRGSKLKTANLIAKRTSLMLYQAVDMSVTSSLWHAAYNKAKGVMLLSEQEAIQYADSVIYSTQPQGGNVFLPAMFRGNEMEKLFTMFMNQPNQNLNIALMKAYDIKKSDISTSKKIIEAGYGALMLVLAPSFLLGLIGNRLRLHDEPEDYVWDVFNYSVAPFPIVNQLMYTFLTEKRWASTTAMSDAIIDVKNALAKKDITDKIMHGSYQAFKWKTGLPLDNTWDIITGEAFKAKED